MKIKRFNEINEGSSIKRIDKIIELLRSGARQSAMSLFYEYVTKHDMSKSEFDSMVSQFEYFSQIDGGFKM